MIKSLCHFSKKIKNNKGVVYAWGELVTSEKAGKDLPMYESMLNEIKTKGEEIPYINEEELDKLALIIKGNIV